MSSDKQLTTCFLINEDESYQQIEKILVTSLPDSAYKYRQWWSNQKNDKHSQTLAWRDAGYNVDNVTNDTVTFKKF